jgi:hypothetical protein
VKCSDGNWTTVDPDTYDDAYGYNGTSIMEIQEYVEDENFYVNCMQEGTVTLSVRVRDYFGRETTFSDDVEYHKDAWGISYRLRDREDDVDGFRVMTPSEDEPRWFFIGVPVIPYNGELSDYNIPGVVGIWLYTEDGWKVFRPGHPELSDLNAFEQGKAYMIDMNWDGLEEYPRFTVWGYFKPETDSDPPVPSVIFTVHAGWNPVAFDLRPRDSIDAGTAFSALNSKEIYTLGRPYDRRDYSGRYWVINGTSDGWGTPIFGRKGYWVYTSNDGVDVHSKYNYDEGWCC